MNTGGGGVGVVGEVDAKRRPKGPRRPGCRGWYATHAQPPPLSSLVFAHVVEGARGQMARCRREAGGAGASGDECGKLERRNRKAKALRHLWRWFQVSRFPHPLFRIRPPPSWRRFGLCALRVLLRPVRLETGRGSMVLRAPRLPAAALRGRHQAQVSSARARRGGATLTTSAVVRPVSISASRRFSTARVRRRRGVKA